uniref:NAD-dependent epimerase/dehydratase family protein n=1 Tax=Algoriphagus sp. TaxID=1872435 RepID=UPI0040473D8B
MAQIIVTGANGFVGKYLVSNLISSGYQVFEVTRVLGEITEPSTWSSLPQADVVIHLAAKSFVPDSWSDISGFISCNLLGTIEALNYCKSRNAKLVYVSSYLYGNPQKLPISETDELSVNNPYALTKKLAEDSCEFYAKSFGIPVTILRPFNVYGTGQSDQFLIPSLIYQVSKKNKIFVKDLEPKRDYLYIDDLITAISKAVMYEGNFDVFNVGSGISYSVKELIDVIQSCAGTNLPVFSESSRRKNEIMDTVADICHAKESLNWHPEWTLEEGIKRMIDNYNYLPKY